MRGTVIFGADKGWGPGVTEWIAYMQLKMVSFKALEDEARAVWHALPWQALHGKAPSSFRLDGPFFSCADRWNCKMDVLLFYEELHQWLRVKCDAQDREAVEAMLNKLRTEVADSDSGDYDSDSGDRDAASKAVEMTKKTKNRQQKRSRSEQTEFETKRRTRAAATPRKSPRTSTTGIRRH